jgi:putative ABC transport system substrate-binding protein
MTARGRRTFLACLLGSFLARVRVAIARGAPQVLWFRGGQPSEVERKRIREGFAAQGLVDGRDIALTFHTIDDARWQEVLERRPAVIVMMGSHRLPELARLTRDIPVVFYNFSLDPVKLGLIESLRRPGRNFTGSVIQWDEITSKYWQLLKEVRPSMKRGGILIAQEDVDLAPPDALEIRRAAMRHAAQGLRIDIREIPVAARAAADAIAAAVSKAAVEALQVELPASDGLKEFGSRTPLPTAGYSFGAVREGHQLIGVSFDWTEGEQQAIAMAARILRGERPATIPVYRTRQYGIAVNLKLARSVGIVIPESVLIQAAEVVQ